MNVMENKQLDFNQPFLSVRRVLSMEETTSKADETAKSDNNRWPPLPVYKSELKCGPVRNPGNVPFLWEHVPGRPKDGRKSEAVASKRPPAAPKRASGTSSDSKQQHCGKESKSGGATLSRDKSIAKFRTLRERIERDLSYEMDDEGDETYVEANNDSVSRSESFSMSCSITGLSGLDVDGGSGSDVKPSGTFLKDQQTRDFMMGRFLPAAKALASETPQVSHRKQSVQREQQREARKIVEMDKEHRANSLPTMLPSHYPPPNPQNDEDISEEDDTNLGESEYSSNKACGLFTRFCLRGSFCLLHPVPGMKTPTSAHRVQNDNLTHNSCSSIKSRRNEEKSLDGNQMVELQQENSVLKGQLNRKGASNDPKKQYKTPLCEAKVFPSEVHRRGRTKFRELLANESPSASPFVVEKTLHVDSVHNMKCQTSNSSSADTKGMAEFLVDDDHHKHVEGETTRLSSTSMESSESCSSYYDAKPNSKETNSEVDIIQDAARVSANAKVTIDSGNDQSEESLGSIHHKKPSQESSDESFTDFVSFTSSDSSSNKEKLHLESKLVPKGSDVKENYSNVHNHDSITLISSRAATPRGKIDLESRRRPKSSLPISSQLALAPPLPKSPSESWLKRTLPTISSGNSTRRSTLAARIYGTMNNTVF